MLAKCTSPWTRPSSQMERRLEKWGSLTRNASHTSERECAKLKFILLVRSNQCWLRAQRCGKSLKGLNNKKICAFLMSFSYQDEGPLSIRQAFIGKPKLRFFIIFAFRWESAGSKVVPQRRKSAWTQDILSGLCVCQAFIAIPFIEFSHHFFL